MSANIRLTTESNQLPGFVWLSIVPPAILAATALYLHLHWAEIRAQYPVHWDINGQPNGWSTRSIRGVYGPLVFAQLWMTWFIVLALVCRYRSRPSPMRTAMVKVMIATELLFGLISPTLALSPLYKLNPKIIASVVISGIVATVAFSSVTLIRAGTAAGNEIRNAESCGPFWFNRNDPSLLVPRIDGFGYTPNLAHPASWMLALAPFVIVFVGLKFMF